MMAFDPLSAPRTMKLSRLFWKPPALWPLRSRLTLPAQELTLLGGFTAKEKFGKSTYAWQVDYRQNFFSCFAGSVAYINGGHLPGHHRDGNAFALWGRLPLFDGRVAFSVGAGLYTFYDTQTLPSASINVHGNAPIYGLSATGYFSNRTFYRVMLNRIDPAHDLTVITATLGVGVWLGRERKPAPGKLGDTPADEGYVTGTELMLFGGQSVMNTLFRETARAYALEYRRGLVRHNDGTVSLIYEGDPEIVRRSGLAVQAWAVNTFFDERISLGAGVGPYIHIDRKRPATAARRITRPSRRWSRSRWPCGSPRTGSPGSRGSASPAATTAMRISSSRGWAIAGRATHVSHFRPQVPSTTLTPPSL